MGMFFAGLTTYGISYAGIWAGIAADIIPGDLQFPFVMLWSLAGLALAFYGISKAKK